MIDGRHEHPHRPARAASSATVPPPFMAGFPAHLAPATFPLVAPPAGQAAATADDAAIAPRPLMLRITRLPAATAPAAGPLMTDQAPDIHCSNDWGKAARPVVAQHPRLQAAHLPASTLYYRKTGRM